MDRRTVRDRLEQLGLRLPTVAAPRYHYVHAKKHDGTAWLSGKLPIDADGTRPYAGRVGAGVSVDEGRAAARLCALQLLSVADAVYGLDDVEQVLKVTGYVAAGPDFTDLGLVVNGASELFTDVLGERGRHARTAIGVAQLPDDVPVEVDAVIALRNDR